MKKRLSYLDISKGLLIIMVVMGHIGICVHFVYAFHMPAFLVIAGIQFHYSKSLYKSFAEFLKSRFLSLIIPFIFFEVIGVMYHIICFGRTLSPIGYINNTIHQQWNNGPSGFLIHLFGAEIVFFLLMKYISKRSIQLLIAIAIMLISFLAPNHLMPNLLRMMLIYSGFIVIGYYFMSNEKKIPNWNAAICLLITVLISFKGVFLSDAFGNYINTAIYLTGAISGTIFILQISKLLDMHKCKLLEFFGRNSIIILGTHNAFLFPIRTFIISDTTVINDIAILSLIMLCEIPTIHLINRYIPYMVGKKKAMDYLH